MRKHSYSCCWLFQSLKIRKEIVNVRLSELVEQFAMRREGILQLDFDAIAREGPIPTGGVAQSNHKIISMLQRTLDLFAGGKRHHGHAAVGVADAGIEHARLEIDGRVLG